MIYTITFNPAIDLIYQLDELKPGQLNRSKQDYQVIGGKGINASIIFKRLGQENVALGFVGGFTGDYIRRELEHIGIGTDFIELDQTTRLNAKIKARNNETEINGAGPKITSNDMTAFLTKLANLLEAGDVVFLAGNKAPGMASGDYVAVAKICQEKGALLVLDSNGDLLTDSLAYQPFIIKPNQDELGEVFDTQVDSLDQTIELAKVLQDRGARNVLVSLGGKGSLLVTEEGQVIQASAPRGEVVNSTGAGDSMLAAFMSQYLETKDYQQSLIQGAAAGSATAFSVWLAEKDHIEELKYQVKLKII